MIRFLGAALCAALLAALGQANAQTWPAKPIRVIVAGPAGGPGDIPPRGIGQYLAPKLGQPFVIENRPGANGILGAEVCAKAAPDGYTLCSLNNGTVSVNPIAYPSLSYDPPRDFAPIINFGFTDSALIVNPSVPANSMRELLEMARKTPGSLAWSTIGTGSSAHLYVEWFRTQGISFLHVPYKGGDAVMNSVISGDTQVAISAVGRLLPQIKAGKLKPLAILGDRPSPFLPGVATFKDQGVDLWLRVWIGLFAPAGVSKQIVQQLNAEISKLLKDPQYVKQFLYTQGMVPDGGGSPEEFAQFLKDDRGMYERIVKATGVKLE
jgi:tripartite-type tricarboxylate transporter receptor subunit TctC